MTLGICCNQPGKDTKGLWGGLHRVELIGIYLLFAIVLYLVWKMSWKVMFLVDVSPGEGEIGVNKMKCDKLYVYLCTFNILHSTPLHFLIGFH